MPANGRLIVAVDTPGLDAAQVLLRELKGLVNFYKIGLEFFTAHGWKAVELVRKTGAGIFLDLKLHDIPNTVAKTAAVIAEHEIEMFNVHALGGVEMMKAAREAVHERMKSGKKKPMILGVTILTSHQENDLGHVGIAKPLAEEVLLLARNAKEAGLDGVVSSPQEITLLRREMPRDFVIVTPGVRPAGAQKDDQKRTLTAQAALRDGADYLVIGRPITSAAKPREAALSLLGEINSFS